jgi:hypothetical protein
VGRVERVEHVAQGYVVEAVARCSLWSSQHCCWRSMLVTFGPERKVGVDGETGTVIWPGGADLAPDTLYERVRSGAWPDPRAIA